MYCKSYTLYSTNSRPVITIYSMLRFTEYSFFHKELVRNIYRSYPNKTCTPCDTEILMFNETSQSMRPYGAVG